jgi:hypothetical protein
MALDIYVGPLVRYYRGDWETVAQRWSRESGVAHTVIRPGGGDPEPPAPVAEVLSAITDWQGYLNRSLAQHLEEPIAWIEDPAAPYWTDRPGHDPYNALVLWAAYAEQPSLRCPSRVPSDYGKDPAYIASNTKGFTSSVGQLIHEVEIWLPAPFAFTFRAAHLGEGDIGLGSSFTLLDQLRNLNARTWQLSAAALGDLLTAGLAKDASLEAAARFGYAVVEKLAVASTEGRVPMKLDY